MISQRRKRIKGFSSDEKNLLIHCVKNHGSIWDLTDARHSDNNAVREDWDFIAGTLEKTVTECKDAWTSLRESYRYHRKKASLRLRKSGADGGDALESQPKVQWEFGDRMSFLPDFSTKRTTYNTNFTEDDESIDFLDDEISSCSASTPKSSYDYKQKATPGKGKPKSNENMALVEMLGGYLKKSKETIDTHINNQNQKEVSPFASALGYWDSLLKNMPYQQAQLTVI
ncbi:uncharacterized protein [Drosophila takahashii]|uniref:uncharacterized protein n=1 Tax=Drosophila takahashii TaxID=29030 RepID=UPI003898FC3B